MARSRSDVEPETLLTGGCDCRREVRAGNRLEFTLQRVGASLFEFRPGTLQSVNFNWCATLPCDSAPTACPLNSRPDRATVSPYFERIWRNCCDSGNGQ
jgi:hypothetical protein